MLLPQRVVLLIVPAESHLALPSPSPASETAAVQSSPTGFSGLAVVALMLTTALVAYVSGFEVGRSPQVPPREWSQPSTSPANPPLNFHPQ